MNEIKSDVVKVDCEGCGRHSMLKDQYESGGVTIQSLGCVHCGYTESYESKTARTPFNTNL